MAKALKRSLVLPNFTSHKYARITNIRRLYYRSLLTIQRFSGPVSKRSFSDTFDKRAMDLVRPCGSHAAFIIDCS